MKKLAALGFIAALCTSCLPACRSSTSGQPVGCATAAKMTRDNPRLDHDESQQRPGRGELCFLSASSCIRRIRLQHGVRRVTGHSLGGGPGRRQRLASLQHGPAHSEPGPARTAHISAGRVKSGPTFLFGIVFDALNPASSGYAIFQATPPSIFNSNGSSLLGLVLPLGSVNSVIGASVSAPPALRSTCSTSWPWARQAAWRRLSRCSRRASPLRRFRALPSVPSLHSRGHQARHVFLRRQRGG